jgi:hypothetical protein
VYEGKSAVIEDSLVTIVTTSYAIICAFKAMDVIEFLYLRNLHSWLDPLGRLDLPPIMLPPFI